MKFTQKTALISALIFGLPFSNEAKADTMFTPGTLGGTYINHVIIPGNGTMLIVNGYDSTDSYYMNFKYDGAALTEFSGLGGTHSNIDAASYDGSVLVGNAQTTGDTATHATEYLSSSLTPIDLGVLTGGTNSYAQAVSGDGSVIAGRSQVTGGSYHLFTYTTLGGMVDAGSLGSYSTITGISYDGSVMAGTIYDSPFTAFKYDGSSITDLGNLGGSNTYAEAVSGDGLVIAGHGQLSGDAVEHAFKYTTSMIDIGSLGGSTTNVRGISYDGSVIVGSGSTIGDIATHAYRYTGTTMGDDTYSIGTLGGTNSYANAVSRDGSVVIGKSDITGESQSHAFKYTVSGGMIDLGTLSGGTASEATGISSDGTVIVGISKNSDGDDRPFIYGTLSSGSLVDVNNTYASLYYNGTQLNSLINLKNSLLRSTLTQDCNKYGANNLCVAIGSRYLATNQQYNAQESAANLRVAYRFTPNFRAGIILDQAFANNNSNNFTVRNSQPMMGVFANLSQNPDSSGFNLRLSSLYSNSKILTKRNVLADTEAGQGTSNLKSSGQLAELSYGLNLSKKLQIKPFAGIRQTQVVRDGYVENSDISFPISYETVKQKSTTAILGARSSFALKDNLSLQLGFGLERNLKNKMDGYVGTISQVGSFSLNAPNLRKNTAFVDVGLSYDIKDSQTVMANVNYGSQILNSGNVAMVYLGYVMGF